MANVFQIEYVPDFTGFISAKMLDAGMAVLEKDVKASLKHAIGNPMLLKQPSRSTGGLFKSISASHAFKKDGGTRFVANVYFKGEDENKKGMRYGEKAAYKEYGTPHGDRQGRGSVKPSYFSGNALEASRGEITAEMKRVLDEEIAKI